MIRLPTIFQQRYCNDSGEENVSPGFEPFKDEKGNYHLERIVEIIPKAWRQGVYLHVELKDKIQPPLIETTTGLEIGSIKNVKLYDKDYYDKDVTGEQRLLMQALYGDEVRGWFAINIVSQLYYGLIFKDLEEYLPEIKKWKERVGL